MAQAVGASGAECASGAADVTSATWAAGSGVAASATSIALAGAACLLLADKIECLPTEARTVLLCCFTKSACSNACEWDSLNL